MRYLLLLLMACSGVAGWEYYDNNDLELATAYRAKELCSCLFVMGQSEEYCVEWTVAAPNIVTYHIDYAQRAVSTAAALMWGARAHLENERFGCRLDN